MLMMEQKAGLRNENFQGQPGRRRLSAGHQLNRCPMVDFRLTTPRMPCQTDSVKIDRIFPFRHKWRIWTGILMGLFVV
jgi:hypothetical protein